MATKGRKSNKLDKLDKLEFNKEKGKGKGEGEKEKEKEKEGEKEKKSKKKFPVIAVITPEGIEGNLLTTSKKPLIVHLPIQSKDVLLNNMPIAYDPHPPTEAQPYDIHADNPFYDDMESIEPSKPTPVVETVIDVVETTDYYRIKGTLLVQFQNSSDVYTLPEKSDAACFWCCHTFNNRPVILPIRDTGEYIVVMGNFCSPECSTAYLFDMRQDAHTRWEQLALLYRIYGEVCQGKIHPSPSRTVLQLFGGNMSIQDYRSLIQSHQVRVDIHLPPMVSILATMDTKPIDFYDSGLTKNVNETVKERLEKAEEVLRLRRTKPLKAWESTLDACINLKITANK